MAFVHEMGQVQGACGLEGAVGELCRRDHVRVGFGVGLASHHGALVILVLVVATCSW